MIKFLISVMNILLLWYNEYLQPPGTLQIMSQRNISKAKNKKSSFSNTGLDSSSVCFLFEREVIVSQEWSTTTAAAIIHVVVCISIHQCSLVCRQPVGNESRWQGLPAATANFSIRLIHLLSVC